VSAVRDVEAAEVVAQRVRSELGADAAVQLVPGGGFIRVRVNADLPDLGARLRKLGYADAFIAERVARVEVVGSEGGGLTSAVEIDIRPVSDWPVVAGSYRYRGGFRARLSGRSVLLINVLNLEWYLRGVVPAEMGPYVFPEIEAIKAQTVAARTYAVAHRGDHDDEGYDLCATPACQAYHGVGVEHPMSNQAIEATRGLVATFAGEPIDAMYTSTSGGHTENAGLLFADRAAPYLKGRPTHPDIEVLHLTGSLGDSDWLEPLAWRRWLASRALGLDSTGSPTARDIIERLADRCAGTAPPPELGTSPELVARAVTAAGGLESTAVLTRIDDPVWSLLAVADLFEVELAPPPDPVGTAWTLEAAGAVLEIHELYTGETGVAVALPTGVVGLRQLRSETAEPIVGPVPLFERWQDRRRARAALEVEAGTELRRVAIGDELLAVEAVSSGGGGEADRRSAWRGWRRQASWDELAGKLGLADLERLEVVRRGVSGRVVELRAVGASGRHKQWSGFEIRRVLDLPETLFTVHVLKAADGTKVARFLGRGWGHGVGMCQNGAYGLARAGADFVDILATFYRGVDVVPMATLKAPSTAHPRVH
jgi:stage II sporulation protein D